MQKRPSVPTDGRFYIEFLLDGKVSRTCPTQKPGKDEGWVWKSLNDAQTARRIAPARDQLQSAVSKQPDKAREGSCWSCAE